MLHIVTWNWGTKYDREYVRKLKVGISNNLKQNYRFFVAAPRDNSLTAGCFCRLEMFSESWQYDNWVYPGDRIVCIDLDVVITGELDALFNNEEQFSILLNANQTNPCPYNGSVWSIIAGYRPDVWDDFSLEAASKVPYDSFPDDQAWLAAKLPGAKSWQCGADSGIWSFQKRGWPKDNQLPKGARIVAFPGKRDPSQFKHLPWVAEHW